MLLTTCGRQKDIPPVICLHQSRVTVGRMPENPGYNQGSNGIFAVK